MDHSSKDVSSRQPVFVLSISFKIISFGMSLSMKYNIKEFDIDFFLHWKRTINLLGAGSEWLLTFTSVGDHQKRRIFKFRDPMYPNAIYSRRCQNRRASSNTVSFEGVHKNDDKIGNVRWFQNCLNFWKIEAGKSQLIILRLSQNKILHIYG